MKKRIVYFLALLSIGYIVGCTKFEEYQSTEVLIKPVATLSVSDVADSSFTIDFSSDKAGYLGFVVLTGDAVDPVAISILSHSLDGGDNTVALQTYKINAASGASVSIRGLMPNTYYKVAVASSNIDGVESDVKTFIVKTNDGIGPSFVSSSPAISDQESVAVNSDIVLTFDEPIKVDMSKKFTFTYYFEGISVEFSLDSTNVSGNTITVPQSHTGHPGDYLFLSWEAGAVTDLSNNPCNERISGVVNGSLAGNYYLFETVDFSVSDRTVLPESGSVITIDDTTVDIYFPFVINLSDALTADMVKFKYSSWDGLVTTEVSAAASCEIVNDTILRITQPHVPDPGDMIALYLAEGVITDDYGNPNSISEYELNWNLPRLSIDDIIGQYVVTGVSDFDQSVVTDTVSIELNTGEPNSVIITGLFKNLLGSSDPVTGVFDATHSLIKIDEQIIGGDESYYYSATSDISSDYAINVMILDENTMSSDLALGVYDKSFNFLGYGEYLPEVTWTKLSVEKSAVLNYKSKSNVNNKIKIRKLSRGIK